VIGTHHQVTGPTPASAIARQRGLLPSIIPNGFVLQAPVIFLNGAGDNVLAPGQTAG
jgi:hypothetical protein